MEGTTIQTKICSGAPASGHAAPAACPLGPLCRLHMHHRIDELCAQGCQLLRGLRTSKIGVYCNGAVSGSTDMKHTGS